MRQCHLITNFNEVMSEKALIKCLLLNCCWGLWWFYHNTVLSLITVKIKCRGTLWNCNYSWSFAVSQRLSRGCINSCLSKTIMVQFCFFLIASDCDTATIIFLWFWKKTPKQQETRWQGFSLHYLEMMQKGWMPARWSNVYAIIHGPIFSGPPTCKVAAVWPCMFLWCAHQLTVRMGLSLSVVVTVSGEEVC